MDPGNTRLTASSVLSSGALGLLLSLQRSAQISRSTLIPAHLAPQVPGPALRGPRAFAQAAPWLKCPRPPALARPDLGFRPRADGPPPGIPSWTSLQYPIYLCVTLHQEHLGVETPLPLLQSPRLAVEGVPNKDCCYGTSLSCRALAERARGPQFNPSATHARTLRAFAFDSDHQ